MFVSELYIRCVVDTIFCSTVYVIRIDGKGNSTILGEIKKYKKNTKSVNIITVIYFQIVVV